MAATFVVEDGSGVSGANSYIEVADADQYHENFGNPSAWSSLSDDDKKEHLRIATQYVDLSSKGHWKGDKVDKNQALAWPRYYVYDYDDNLLDNNIVPQTVKDAVCVMALESANGTAILATLTNPGIIKKTKDKVGPITEEIEYVDGDSPEPEFAKADQMLAEWLRGGGSVSLVRG